MLQTEELDTASTTKIGCYYLLVGYTEI